MKVFDYTVKDPEGIHALPAGGLIKLAGTFNCSITAQGNGSSVDLKHLFGVMSLGIPTQSEITLACDGDDEENALNTIVETLKAQKVIG